MGLDLGGTPQPATQLGGGLNLGRQPEAPAPTPAPTVGGGLSLQKGAKMDLTKGNPGLDRILVGLGWDVNASGGQDFDLDVEVFALGADGRVVDPSHVIFYNNLVSPDGAIRHNGDNRTGQGQGDDETVSVQLSQLSQQVQKIVFAVTIDQAIARQQNFGQVNNAYIRIVNEATGQEIYRFDLTEDYSTSISLKAGEVYRHNGEFKFGATGTGSASDLAGLCVEYGAM